jgi:hypothetical protein
MKNSILLLLAAILLLSFRKQFDWDVPRNPETGKITYSGVMAFEDINKQMVFRRIKKFVAIKDYDKTENIKCKDRTIVVTKFYEKSIRYEDTIDGVIVGSGYMPVLWRRFNYIWVVFDYKIQALDNGCKYEMSNFKVLNFFAAPKAKSKSSGIASVGVGAVYGFASGSTSMSANLIQQVALEDYLNNKGERDSYNMHFREHPEIFIEEMESIRKGLTKAVTESF